MIKITLGDLINPNNQLKIFPISLDETNETHRDFMSKLMESGLLNNNGTQKLNEIGIT